MCKLSERNACYSLRAAVEFAGRSSASCCIARGRAVGERKEHPKDMMCMQMTRERDAVRVTVVVSKRREVKEVLVAKRR